MLTPQDFAATVQAIISRHPEAAIADRWEEAGSIDLNRAPDTSWIRESDDLINIVWLTDQGIIADITWFPSTQTATFSYLRLSTILQIEIRQGPNLGQQMGLSLSGELVATVHTSSHRAGLVWIASDAENATELRAFVSEVLKRIVEVQA